MSNKITGASRLQEQDVDFILKYLDKGLSVQDVSEISGWSIATVRKVASGRYYEQKLDQKIRQRARSAQKKLSGDVESLAEPTKVMVAPLSDTQITFWDDELEPPTLETVTDGDVNWSYYNSSDPLNCDGLIDPESRALSQHSKFDVLLLNAMQTCVDTLVEIRDMLR